MNSTLTRPVLERRADQIQPGHIMVDGIVLGVQKSEQHIRIEFRNVVYTEPKDASVQIFGRVRHDVVAAIIKAELARGNL